MRKTLGITLALVLPFALAGLLSASPIAGKKPSEHPEHPAAEGAQAEHPENAEHAEHPEDGEHAEHAEHPEETAAPAEPLTMDELADAMETWVESESQATGGYLEVEDAETGETLQLTLDQVHRERLSRTAEQTYFACADFRGADGTLYDVDIFMEGPNKDSLEATEVTVHKVEGEARYTWYEEDGIWKKRPIES